MIIKAYEELINLDQALAEALDCSGIDGGGKYNNLWYLPMNIFNHSRFESEEIEHFLSNFHKQNPPSNSFFLPSFSCFGIPKQ